MTRNTTLCALAALALLAAGDTTRLNAQTPAPELRVRQLLALASLTQAQALALDSLRSTMLGQYKDVVADIASDTTAGELTRGHALMELGQNYVFAAPAFAQALTDRSVLVRAYAAQAMRTLLVSNDSTVTKLVILALHDPDDRVQSKALESLGDREPQALQLWLAEKPGPSAPLRTIAQQFIDLAQDRGAPLEPAAGSNVLQRISNGITIRYTPRMSWPQWDASAGTVSIGRGGTAPVDVAGDVEVVGNVVPAFVSSDGRALVYEAARTIHVRDLGTGVDRVISPGIAPRTFPFTDGFIFLRPETKPLVDDPVNGTQLFYEVVRLPFNGTASPDVIGHLTARTKLGVHGAYAPVRWMRVRENDGGFWLDGPGVTLFALPDPFGSSARPKPAPK